MVKIARILTAAEPTTPILSAQIPIVDSSISTQHAYINLTSIATTASHFLSLGKVAIARANLLIATVTSSDATPEQSKLLIPQNNVTRVLSPLDGQTEVNKFICIGETFYVSFVYLLWNHVL